jgi:hypothetical protein
MHIKSITHFLAPVWPCETTHKVKGWACESIHKLRDATKKCIALLAKSTLHFLAPIRKGASLPPYLVDDLAGKVL